MNKKLLIASTIFVLIGVGFFFSIKNFQKIPIAPISPQGEKQFDPRNAIYEIEGRKITLTNGLSEVEISPGSASKIITRYFGNEAKGDLNGDGREDIAFLITQDGGGSGLFYYAVVALKTPVGYKITNTFFLGDRIAPQSTEINTNALELRINYAERKPNEPMTTKPSVGVTKILKVSSEGVLNG